jgi:hypothetical protein
MRSLDARTTRTVHDLTGVYGRGPFRTGILSDHLHIALAAGMELRTGQDGDYVKDADGDTALILCSELVEVWTEDGRSTGRCGTPVLPDQWACEAHWFDRDTLCDHGLTAALCSGPQHY